MNYINLQTKFPDERIRKYGCYFLQLLNAAHFDGSVEDIIKVFTICKSQKYIDDECFVYNPIGIANTAGGRFTDCKIRKAPIYPCIARLTKPGYAHFVMALSDTEIIDTLDPNRAAAKQYVRSDYRILV